MDTGVAIFPTHDAIGPAEVARLAEERGHESLLFFPSTRASRLLLAAGRLDRAGGEVAGHVPGCGVGVVRRLDQVSQGEAGR